MQCQEIDRKTFNHSSGHVEEMVLYRTKEKMPFLADSDGNQGEYMAFFKEVCPPTGSVYLLDTLPTFTKVEEAAKFHRPQFIPSELKYNHS